MNDHDYVVESSMPRGVALRLAVEATPLGPAIEITVRQLFGDRLQADYRLDRAASLQFMTALGRAVAAFDARPTSQGMREQIGPTLIGTDARALYLETFRGYRYGQIGIYNFDGAEGTGCWESSGIVHRDDLAQLTVGMSAVFHAAFPDGQSAFSPN